MYPLVLILSFVSEVYLSHIAVQGDTSVVFGHDAHLSCSLPHTSGVKHVTWQRVRKDAVQTLATFSEQFKNHVDEQFVGKLAFNASLNSTHIVIKNTTFEDESCYVCSFKVYPTGPKRETICLTVKGITELTVDSAPSSDSEVDISCSATGKPTPTIKWISEGQELNMFMSNINTVLNKDSSTTITSNLTLPLSRFHGKSVECLVQADDIEKREQIIMPRHHKENSTTSRNYIITVSILSVMAVVVFIIVICLHFNLKRATFEKRSFYVEPLHTPLEEC